MRPLVGGLDGPECVVVDRRHRLWAGGRAGQLYCFDPVSQDVRIFALDGGGHLLGLCVDDTGAKVLVCDMSAKVVRAYDAEAGSSFVVLSEADGRKLDCPNFLVHRGEDDGMWLTDSGEWGSASGRLIRLDGHGRVDHVIDGLSYPNGMCVMPGGRLLVVESNPPRLCVLDPRMDALVVVAELPGCVPDGVVAMTDGSAIVTCYEPDLLVWVEPSSGQVAEVPTVGHALPRAPANACVLPHDPTQLVISGAEGSELAVVDLPAAAHPAPTGPIAWW